MVDWNFKISFVFMFIEMARTGCNIIDFATASMADGTPQPSLNAFLAMMEGSSRDTGINFMSLEPYDTFWINGNQLLLVRLLFIHYACI